MHNHESTFISILLWGQYQEITRDPQKGLIEINDRKWFNILNYKKFHEIRATKPVYTLLFMGPTKQNTSVMINDKIIPSERLIKGYK